MKLRLKPNGEKGKLIVFEGTDGAGKTSLIEITKRYLQARLGEDQVVQVKQPTDLSRKTRLFQKMMFCPQHTEIDYRAVQLLTLSDRLQHQHEVILPALRAGKVVISDRYVFTSVANMECRGFSENWFYRVARNIVRPDLCILAAVTPQLALERIRKRLEERDRYFDESLLIRVAEYFKKHAREWDMIVLDTSFPVEKTFEKILPFIEGLFGEAL